jgi:glycosyltransferase involved in cell wall biosynthesis
MKLQRREAIDSRISIVHVYKSFDVYNGLIEILTIMANDIDHGRYRLIACVNRYQGNPFGRQFESAGGEIVSLGVRPGLLEPVREFFALLRYFLKTRPAVVQTHVLRANLIGLAAARLAGIRAVVATEMTLQDTAFTAARRFRDRCLRPFVSFMLSRSSAFVATSRFIADQWMRNHRTLAPTVILPPFNLKKLQDAQEAEPEPLQRPALCYVGRLSEEKGVEWLVSAMGTIHARAPRVHLYIVGTGPLHESLKQKSAHAAWASYIHFVGHRPNVFEVLRSVDCLVLPSRSEGCPLVVLEAMAAGVPVIATAVGGTPELIESEKSGILVAHGDTPALALAVEIMINDTLLAKRLAARARELAFSRFHPSAFTSGLTGLYEKLLGRKLPGGSHPDGAPG